MCEEPQKEAEEQQADGACQEKKPVAGHALLVSQGAQALDAARRQLIDELGIGQRTARNLFFEAQPDGQKVKLAHAQFVEMLRRGSGFA